MSPGVVAGRFGEYLERCAKQRLATNVLAFAGHAKVRQRVMGKDFKRAATEAEIAMMAELVEQGMRAGAFGLSTGLEYDVGHPSSTEEVIELSKVVAKYRGIYMSHVRDEAVLAFDAFREAIRIGILNVFFNGVAVVDGGKATGARSGEVLRPTSAAGGKP